MTRFCRRRRLYLFPAQRRGGGGSGLPDNAALEQKSTAASGGTLCFGDIDRLDKAEQAQFLRFIERQVEQGHLASRRGGSGAGSRKTFQLMATAAEDLEELVAEGSFSIGLYKRLGTRILHVPPLRRRREDIAEIARHILARIVGETKHAALSGISGAAAALLTQYDWPGNFAELENMMFRAVLLSEGRLLVSRDFPQLLREDEGQEQPADSVASSRLFYDAAGHIKPLAEVEKSVILEAMQRYRGKISEVARRLQIGRSTLYRKLEDYGIYPDK
ncbi:MAG: sigma-54-dependent Fis family transcriptional regulator [Candidatus Tokpelaia sp.]|nr:MAG: sigma-54-dependent Fis family transcriptional regulator [Candidatus Tokpelaia sp.]KAA6207370.1 MAG: sigma-54-dependent Fis family transcriptional regulator [Candidatus Tokpelaia sp.]